MPASKRIALISHRSEAERNLEGLSFRQLAVVPKTIDPATRSLDFIISTEAPVAVMDRDKWEVVNEILFQSGMIIPENGQVPMQDTHDRSSVTKTLGSLRQIRVDSQQKVSIGRGFFARDKYSIDTFQKYEDGHLTDISVSYRVVEYEWVEAGERRFYEGREYEGPVKLTKKWELREASPVPIGADSGAKARESVQSPKPENKEGISSSSRAEQISGGIFSMNKKLKNLLIQRGLAAGSTDEQALAFLGAMSPDTQGSLRAEAEKPDTVKVLDEDARAAAEAEGQRKEQERCKAIRATCPPGCEEVAERMINENKTVEQTMAAVIEHMRTSNKPVGGRIEMGLTGPEKFRAAAVDAVALRAGLILPQAAPGANELRGMSLIRLCEEFLRSSGQSISYLDPSDMVGRAMTSTDFPLILANSANKVMQQMYEIAPETWDMWCEQGEGRDFKAMTRPQFSAAPAFTLVKENGEYNEIAFKEIAPSLTIQTYGAECSLTRQMVINDDLQAFLRIPKAFGLAAQRKIGDLVYAILTANGNINSTGSALALFVAGHSNITTLQFGVDGITELRRLLRVMPVLQNQATPDPMGLPLKYLIVPAKLETAADLVTTSVSYPEKNAGNLDNPVRKMGLTPVPEARLDANSTTLYYGATDYNLCGTVEVAFLNNVKKPVIVQSEGANPDIRKFNARIDVGVGPKDHRGLVRGGE